MKQKLLKLITKITDFICFKVLRLKKHENNLGTHFYLWFNPHQLYCVDFYVARINIFWPLFISVSFGLLGHKGLQTYFGIKYDPTEHSKLGENDYMLSASFRIHKLGENCRTNSGASF